MFPLPHVSWVSGTCMVLANRRAEILEGTELKMRVVSREHHFRTSTFHKRILQPNPRPRSESWKLKRIPAIDLSYDVRRILGGLQATERNWLWTETMLPVYRVPVKIYISLNFVAFNLSSREFDAVLATQSCQFLENLNRDFESEISHRRFPHLIREISELSFVHSWSRWPCLNPFSDLFSLALRRKWTRSFASWHWLKIPHFKVH